MESSIEPTPDIYFTDPKSKPHQREVDTGEDRRNSNSKYISIYPLKALADKVRFTRSSTKGRVGQAGSRAEGESDWGQSDIHLHMRVM
jgi:hypothetical protein